MTILQPILSVREIPPACSKLRQHLPSLREYTAPVSADQEQAVLDYLGQGVLCGLYHDRGLLNDVLQTGRPIEVIPAPERGDIHPHMILTDGSWVWPGALLYYVQTYHLRLPPAFLRHAESKQWRIDPASVPIKDLSWDAFDAGPSAVESTSRA